MQIKVKLNKKGIWCCRLYLGLDAFGKPIKPYKSFPIAATKEEAQVLAETWASHLTADGKVKSARLFDLLNDYILLKQRNGASPNSIKSYRLFTNNYVAHYLRNANAGDLNVMDFNRFEQNLLASKDEGGQGLSRNSVLAVHHFLRGAYNHFVDAGICESNPLVYVAKPHPERKEAAALDEWDFAQLDKSLRSVAFGADHSLKDVVYAFAAWLDLRTGLRCGEMCALRRRDINRMVPYVHVGGNVVEDTGKKPYRRDVTKGRKCRNVTITQDDVTGINSFLSLQNSLVDGLTPDSPLITVDGSFVRPSDLSSAFSSIRDQLKLTKKLTFHGLRHTHATWCLMNGVDLKTLSERLGHADEATTLRIYAHVLPGRDSAAAQVFSDAVSRVSGGY